MTKKSTSIGILKRQLSIELFQGGARKFFWLRIALFLLFGVDGRACVATLRIDQALRRSNRRFLAARMQRRVERRFQCYISPEAEIDDGLRLPHPVGIVIGSGATIGKRCTIYQNVSVGSVHWEKGADGPHPTIGDDVLLSTGAVLIGPIIIGNKVNVGANAVVRTNVPDGRTAVGVPARLVPLKVAA